MRQYTSHFLKSVALYCLLYPVAFPIFAVLMFDIPVLNCYEIAFFPLFWVACVLSVVTGMGLWDFKRWSWYTFFALCVLTVYLNVRVAIRLSQSTNRTLALVAMLGLVLAVLYRVAREVRVPYLFPKIRWWESNPRYKLSVPVRLKRAGGDILEGEIQDISTGGCFVKLRSELQKNEPLQLVFAALEIPVSCEGVVVWKTQSTVTHPKGVGIKFRGLSTPNRRLLKVITRRLRKISRFYLKSRHVMNADEFQKRLAEMQALRIDTDGKGGGSGSRRKTGAG